MFRARQGCEGAVAIGDMIPHASGEVQRVQVVHRAVPAHATEHPQIYALKRPNRRGSGDRQAQGGRYDGRAGGTSGDGAGTEPGHG